MQPQTYDPNLNAIWPTYPRGTRLPVHAIAKWKDILLLIIILALIRRWRPHLMVHRNGARSIGAAPMVASRAIMPRSEQSLMPLAARSSD